MERTFRCKVRNYFKELKIDGLTDSFYEEHEGEFLYLMDCKYGKESRVSTIRRHIRHITEFENLSKFYNKTFNCPT